MSPSRLINTFRISAALSMSATAACASGNKAPPLADAANIAMDAGTGVALPEGGASGGACTVNADCADSEAAQAIDNVRCTGFEIYCLDGECHGDCGMACTAVRTDINPCPPPSLCNPEFDVCKFVPLRCNSPSDCPVYLPPTLDGGTAAWSCDAGFCSYPDFQYATH